ncbi:hypothetical protein K2173_003189 [Erythroxylum novogranatense]|uniref:BHLH domain-containing protein n=1 Tax=Erythroxylum novogranatense TaxID=1862640 RepID=A0AAV8SWX1_9ROSI|nr:hypothetical protein K2173_003189 [Erythroxylum novogranatense]
MKERERRTHMKDLTAVLASLLPSQSNKFTIPRLLDEATRHVKNLQEKIEKLKQVRNELSEERHISCMENDMKLLQAVPVIDINSCFDDFLEVNIFSKWKKLLLHDLIHVFVEEGAQVINLTYHDSGNGFTYTFKLKALYTRVGVDTSRIRDRLTELIYAATDIVKNN